MIQNKKKVESYIVVYILYLTINCSITLNLEGGKNNVQENRN